MRLLLTAASLRPDYGGPAVSVSQLATALGASGLDVALWAADGSVDTELLSPDAKVHRLRGGLREAAGAFAPDAVHDNGLWLAHNHRIAEMARAIGLPRVVSTRGMLEPWAIRHKAWKKQLAWRLYQRRDLDRAAALHATAEPEAANLAQFGFAAPVSTIPNGVDIPPLTVRPALPECKARTALFLGRIYPVKGLPMLVEAWASVRPAGWRLVIAGPDEAGHKGVVERAARAAGLGDVVRFAGAVSGDAKHALLAGADLFVLPSHSESFGMVVAEALAHGKPVLTTTAVPWPALQSRGCGWRTAPSTEGLAAGLREACACDDDSLRQMGLAGRALVSETLGWDRIAAKFVTLYERLIVARTSERRAAA
jgi:glycosyltransferase involved in cell wall biosynthesis